MNASEFCRRLQPKYATVAGVRTHYVTCGQGPTIVLIHGLTASFWNWWHNLPVLAGNFHVIAYDIKGCGNSDKAPTEYTPEACSEQLLGLLDHLGIERAALVAHSMGTRIALQTAIAVPDRLRALVLVAPSCYPQTAGRPISFLIMPGLGELYTRAIFAGQTERLVRRALRFCMHPSVPVTADEIFWNMQSGAAEQRQLGQSYLRFGRHMQFHKPWTLVTRLGEIRAPALVIGSEADPFVPPDDTRRLAAALPAGEFEIWPFTRHMPFAEHPERFNARVNHYLQRQLSADRAHAESPQTA